jgi:hypothetical protein
MHYPLQQMMLLLVVGLNFVDYRKGAPSNNTQRGFWIKRDLNWAAPVRQCLRNNHIM